LSLATASTRFIGWGVPVRELPHLLVDVPIEKLVLDRVVACLGQRVEVAGGISVPLVRIENGPGLAEHADDSLREWYLPSAR